ncbi:MAG: hypothetical protein ISS47_09075 [Candidatus Omnitrophica bacterium]|nr:hypothetical protein [Candidatus Omnitrophota bacterium]
MQLGTIGGIIGGIIGVIGGLIGSYFSIKNTKGPKEKAFMIKAVIVCWIAVTAFLALLHHLPEPFNFLLWVPYIIALCLVIRYGNKKQQQIRREEGSKSTMYDKKGKLGIFKLFSPVFSGVYSSQKLSDIFLDNLTKRIQKGLFSQASERRNRYVIKNRTEDELRFCSSGLLSGAYIGLNDVTVKIELGTKFDKRIIFHVRYWAWTLYNVGLGLLIVLAIIACQFVIFRGLFLYWWHKQPDFFQGYLWRDYILVFHGILGLVMAVDIGGFS